MKKKGREMTLSLYETRNIVDLRDLLDSSTRLYGDKQAFLLRKEEDKGFLSISFNEFHSQVEMLGSVFAEMGLQGCKVAVIGENRYEWCLTYLATVIGGGVIVPLDKELTQPEIQNLMKRSEVRAVFFSKKVESKIMESAANCPQLKYLVNMDLEQNENNEISFKLLMQRGRELKYCNSEFVEQFKNAVIDPEAMVSLLFTSGTTGEAKGVMLSHKNICSNIVAVIKTVNVGPQDHSLSVLPLHHTYECSLGFLAVLYCGASISFNDSLRNLLKNFKDFKPTIFMCVPLLLENVYKKVQDKARKDKKMAFKLKVGLLLSDFLYNVLHIDKRRQLFHEIHDTLGGSVRLIIVGAAAMDAEICHWFERIGILVLQGYGLTECSPLVTGNRDRSYVHGSVGVPMPGVEIKINNPDENGIGEIITKGDNVMLGYYNNQEATAEVIRNGWFFTGDLGCLDKKGFLHITGRSKNVIVTKTGKNIFPEEIEAYLNKSPYVKESVVCAQYDQMHDDIMVSACIFPNFDFIKETIEKISITNEELTEIFDGVIKNVNVNLPVYKKIKSFSLREHEFIKTTTNKIKRHAINS